MLRSPLFWRESEWQGVEDDAASLLFQIEQALHVGFLHGGAS